MREIILTTKLGLWTKYAGIYSLPKKSTLAKYTKNIYIYKPVYRESKWGKYRSKFTHSRRRSCRRVVPVERERERERAKIDPDPDPVYIYIRERERERERESR
jgi:hypothetical protein